jgi:hypothetical protein
MKVVKAAPFVTKNPQGLLVVSIGFSGTRHGLNDFQKAFLKQLLQDKCGTFHHGDCVGADSDAHDIVKSFHDKWRIIIHPPENPRFRAFKQGGQVLKPKGYYARNYDIAEESNVFVGMPIGPTEKGGTWNTINQFRSILAFEFDTNAPPRQGYIILPDGRKGTIVVESKNRALLHKSKMN